MGDDGTAYGAPARFRMVIEFNSQSPEQDESLFYELADFAHLWLDGFDPTCEATFAGVLEPTIVRDRADIAAMLEPS